jgi:hypothetical protein
MTNIIAAYAPSQKYYVPLSLSLSTQPAPIGHYAEVYNGHNTIHIGYIYKTGIEPLYAPRRQKIQNMDYSEKNSFRFDRYRPLDWNIDWMIEQAQREDLSTTEIVRDLLVIFTKAYLDLLGAEYPLAEPAYSEDDQYAVKPIAFVGFCAFFAAATPSIEVIQTAIAESASGHAAIITTEADSNDFKQLAADSSDRLHIVTISGLAARSELRDVISKGVGFRPCVTAFVKAINFLAASGDVPSWQNITFEQAN